MIKKRNMVSQVLLFIVTFGIYGIYWFYVTSKEILDHKKMEGNPGLWTVLLFIPFGAIISYWKQSECVEAITDGRYNRLLVFLAWFVFSPIVWFLTQSELNKRAAASA